MIGKKLYLMLIVLFICITLTGGFIYYRSTYLYMPYEYPNSEMLYMDSTIFRKPMSMEICSDLEEERVCVEIENLEEIEHVIKLYSEVEYVTRSRKEFEELDYVWPYEHGEHYDHMILVIVKATDIEFGKHNVITLKLIDGQKYINGPHGLYYYYEQPQELVDYVIKLLEDNIE